MRGAFLRLAVLALAALAAGCSSFKSDAASLTCPGAEIAPDLDSIAQFPPGSGHAVSDIQFGGKIRAVKPECKREDSGIASDLDINFFAVRGGLQLRRTDLPYFVAISDNAGNILAKRNFTAAVEFTGTRAYTELDEKITAHLPLRNVANGDAYTIIVGFQLSPDELAFNREQREQ